MPSSEKLKPGTLVELIDPEELALDDCKHGLILSMHCEADPKDLFFPDNAGYRVLCGHRILILARYEFEVIR